MQNSQSPCLLPEKIQHSSLTIISRRNAIPRKARPSLLLFTVAALLPAATLAQSTTSSSYTQTNIVSDGSVAAQKTDPTLINPWGVSIGPDFWIDTAGSGFSLVEDSSGNKAFAVSIPPPRPRLHMVRRPEPSSTPTRASSPSPARVLPTSSLAISMEPSPRGTPALHRPSRSLQPRTRSTPTSSSTRTPPEPSSWLPTSLADR